MVTHTNCNWERDVLIVTNTILLESWYLQPAMTHDICRSGIIRLQQFWEMLVATPFLLHPLAIGRGCGAIALASNHLDMAVHLYLIMVISICCTLAPSFSQCTWFTIKQFSNTKEKRKGKGWPTPSIPGWGDSSFVGLYSARRFTARILHYST